MISWEKSKSGLPVVRYGPYQLSSFTDPQAEANRWAAKMVRGIAPQWHVIVLGLGSGYHILSLLKNLKPNQITILSLTQGLAESVRRNVGDRLAGTEIFEGHKLSDFLVHDKVLMRLDQAYVVLRFTPAEVHDRPGYKEVADFLSGRDPYLFGSLVQTQRYWRHLLRCYALPSEGGQRLLSIKDLADVSRARIKTSLQSHDEGILALLALREMVK